MKTLGTPYPMLDELTGGFDAGEMIVVAAGPSMGKTAFLLNLAEHMAIANDVPVAFFSLELPREQLLRRLLCAHLNIDFRAARRGTLSPEVSQQMEEARDTLANGRLYIDNSASVTAAQLSTKAGQLKADHDIQCIFIDYFQLMDNSGLTTECHSLLDRQDRLAELSGGIKKLARALDVPVVVAFQLSAPPSDRRGHRPRISDLREARPVGEDADVLAFIHSEDFCHHGQGDYEPTGVTELIIAKHGNGLGGGIVPLVFHPQFLRFEQLVTEHAGRRG